jgi:hypothetical protein
MSALTAVVWSGFGSQELALPCRQRSYQCRWPCGRSHFWGHYAHAAECLSGITIHQLANPGAPIVWGGAPAIFDMRKGTTPMGAVETAMIDASYAEVGKSLYLPTHCYLGASDSKLVDAQAGLESGMSALLGASRHQHDLWRRNAGFPCMPER